MKKKHNSSSPIFRIVITLVLVILAVNSVLCQDTVRLNDPRFLYPQLPHKNFYFFRGELFIGCNYNVMSPTSGIGHECVLNRESATIYGIAVPLKDIGSYSNRGDLDFNVLWLKIADSIPENEYNPVLDSVKLTQASEQKTLLLDEIVITESGEITDSIVRDAHTLYCGYFSRPIHITDSSFFICARPERGAFSIPVYGINSPEVTAYQWEQLDGSHPDEYHWAERSDRRVL